MRLLFLSYIYFEESLGDYKKSSKSGLDFAADTFCRSIMKGLDENKVSWNAVNVPHLGSYPVFNRKSYVAAEKSKDGKIVSIGYSNWVYFKRYSIRHNVYEQIVSWCSKYCNSGEEMVLLIYNFDMLPVLKDIKKQFTDLKIVMLVTDLMAYMPINNKLFRLLDFFDSSHKNNFLEQKCQYVDGFILLAEAMSEKLPICGKPCLLMEGIYSPVE